MMQPLWGRILASNLKNSPIVETVKLNRHRVAVKYTTGVWEYYYFHEKPRYTLGFVYVLQPEDTFLRKTLPIYGEFETDPFDPKHTGNVLIKRKDLNAASFIEKRVTFHILASKLLKWGMRHYDYPEPVLQQDLEDLREAPLAKNIRRGSFLMARLSSFQIPGSLVLGQYFGHLEPYGVRRLIRAMWQVSKRKEMDMTTGAILQRVRWLQSSKRLFSPVGYAALLHRLKVKGPVIDMHPELGHKALACWKLGLPYCPVDNDEFKLAMERGFNDFVGMNIVKLEDIEKASLVISDNNFKGHVLDVSLADRAAHLLSYANFDELEKITRPPHIFNVVKHKYDFFAHKHDYLLFW